MDKRAREKKKTELSSPTEKIRSEEKKAIRKKKTGVILAIILIYLVVVAAAAIIIDDRHIEIKLNGPEVDLAEVGQPYTDPGAEGEDRQRRGCGRDRRLCGGVQQRNTRQESRDPPQRPCARHDAAGYHA